MKLDKQLARFGRLLMNESMKKHTSFRIGGTVKYFLYPRNVMCLMEVLHLLRQEGVPYRVLGRGSNLLVCDEDFDGVCISLERGMDECWFSPDGSLTCGAGCSLVALSHEACKWSLSGLEFASGIPGSVGGGLYMNAGAYRQDLAGILEEVLVLKHDALEWMKKEDLGYSYRKSDFQSHPDWIIVAARFRLRPEKKETIRRLMESRQRRRMDSQPLNMPSAGSTFRNPEGVQAWELIDALGFRGVRAGGAQVSEKHSNFIVNTGDATCQDVEDLIGRIRQAAMDRYGVDLIPEVERLVWST